MGKSNTGAKVTFYMTLAVLFGFSIILLMNAAAFLGVIPSKYLSPNDIRGIAVEHHNKLYTLNFSQQNELIDIINRASPVGQAYAESRKVTLVDAPQIKKIIIYRFHTPDLEVIPMGFVSKTTSLAKNSDSKNTHMVFYVPEWDTNGLLQESTSNELHNLLLSTYGP